MAVVRLRSYHQPVARDDPSRRDPPVAGQPARVITLVHGTFARDARWTKPGSPLVESLASDDTVIERFHWSGRNRQVDRLHAGRSLHERLLQLAEKYPASSHHVIAHSHGGNVALYALREGRQLDTRLENVRVITMATPFLVMRNRRTPTVLLVVLGYFTLALVTAALWLAVRAITGVSSSDLASLDTILIAIYIATGLAVLAGLLTSARLYQQIDRSVPIRDHLLARTTKEAAEAVTVPTLPRDRLVVIRPIGDEPGGVLAATQLASWLWWRILLLLNYVSHTANTTRGSLTFTRDRYRTATRRQRLTVAAGVLLLAWFALPLALTAIVLFIASSYVLGLPLAAALVLTNLPFGLDTLFWNLHAHLSSEPAPPGLATLNHVRNPTGSNLAHSVYDDPEAIALIQHTTRTPAG